MTLQCRGGLDFAAIRKQIHHHGILQLKTVDRQVQAMVHGKRLEASKKSACVAACKAAHLKICGEYIIVLDDGDESMAPALSLNALRSKFDDVPALDIDPWKINKVQLAAKSNMLFKNILERHFKALSEEDVASEKKEKTACHNCGENAGDYTCSTSTRAPCDHPGERSRHRC